MKGSMEENSIFAAIEAVLFATGRAVSASEIAQALSLTPEMAALYTRNFQEMWNSAGHGTEVIELEDAWQMCTRKEYYPQLIALELNPGKPRLTDVLLETLSVVAYKQPVTKAEIERIRGVNCDHAVNKLVEYHLIMELGRAQQPGRPILFGTTQDFLRVFGITSRDTLPVINPLKAEDFRLEAEAEAGAARAETPGAGPETGASDLVVDV